MENLLVDIKNDSIQYELMWLLLPNLEFLSTFFSRKKLVARNITVI